MPRYERGNLEKALYCLTCGRFGRAYNPLETESDEDDQEGEPGPVIVVEGVTKKRTKKEILKEKFVGKDHTIKTLPEMRDDLSIPKAEVEHRITQHENSIRVQKEVLLHLAEAMKKDKGNIGAKQTFTSTIESLKQTKASYEHWVQAKAIIDRKLRGIQVLDDNASIKSSLKAVLRVTGETSIADMAHDKTDKIDELFGRLNNENDLIMKSEATHVMVSDGDVAELISDADTSDYMLGDFFTQLLRTTRVADEDVTHRAQRQHRNPPPGAGLVLAEDNPRTRDVEQKTGHEVVNA